MAARKFTPAIREKCKKQVEFYFSDSNAPRDKFLMEKIEAHPEGYVDLAIIAAFARMCQHIGLESGLRPDEIPTNVISQLADVLQESETVEVSKDRLWVRRKAPFKSRDDVIQDLDKRSVYFRPFPFDATIDQLQPFFSQYGPVQCVRLRRFTVTKDFKGSLFVEFDTEESAQKVAKMTDLVYEGAPLRPEMKIDYTERKKEEHRTFTEQRKALHLAKENGEAEGPDKIVSPEGVVHYPVELTYTKGLVLQFEIKGDEELPEEFHYGTLKSTLGGKDAGIGYVDLKKGERIGRLRMYNEDCRDTLLGKRNADGVIPMDKHTIEFTLVEGDEEKEFYKLAEENRLRADIVRKTGGGTLPNVKRKRDYFDQSRGRGRGRGRFGRRGRIG